MSDLEIVLQVSATIVAIWVVFMSKFPNYHVSSHTHTHTHFLKCIKTTCVQHNVSLPRTVGLLHLETFVLLKQILLHLDVKDLTQSLPLHINALYQKNNH